MKHNEEFASYEIALQLKDVGFNVPCIARWEKKTFVMNHLANYYNHNAGEVKQGWISAPTWWQVKKWLKNQGIVVEANLDWSEKDEYETNYCYSVYILEDTKLKEANLEEFDFGNEEEALEHGILAALRYLEKNS